MPEETQVADASSEQATDLADILGTAEAAGSPAEATAPGEAAGETAVAEVGEEAAREEAVETEQAPEADESQLAPEEGEVDYADEVYARYAKHYSNQWKAPINPEDPAHRAMLREIIQRGENFRALQSRVEQDAARGDAAAEEAVEAPEEEAAAPAQETPEQLQAFLSAVDKFVEPRIRPEIASKFLGDFMQALWPEQWTKMAGKVSPEVGKRFTKAMTTFGYLFLNDALPEILESYVPGLVNRAYPGFDRVTQDAVFEQAYDRVAGMTRADGSPAYPEIEQLVENEAFDAVYESNPWLRDHQFADKNGRLLSPVQQEARRLEMAIALARGERPAGPAPELLKKAVETGKQQVRRAQNVSALGKLSPGETRGEFGQAETEAEALLKGMNQFGDRDRSIQDMLAPKPK